MNDAGLADLTSLVDTCNSLPGEDRSESLMRVLPELGATYQGAASSVAARFVQEAGACQNLAVDGFWQADPDPPASWRALIGVATARSLAQENASRLFIDFLAGGFTRRLTEVAFDTVAGGGQRAGMAYYQRVARPGCCAFCAMLASRGAQYCSERQALYAGSGPEGTESKLTGRFRNDGRPILKPGADGRGDGMRASRRAGEKFHDKCQCIAVPLAEGNQVELDHAAQSHFEIYQHARDQAEEAGVMTAQQKQKMILNLMRTSMGT
ncbi:VG15 protein [Rothia koreensis]|uniref:VG15 protein n=1 Tax=Rothia koreensis TaxID=592378 RepID=UPI003FCE4E7F